MAVRDICRCLVRHLNKSPRSFRNEAVDEINHYFEYPAKQALVDGRSLPLSARRMRLERGRFRASPPRSDDIVPSFMSLARVSLGFANRPIWMSLSTVSEGQQQIVVENVSTDMPNGAVVSEVQASVQEFVPFTENSPRTSLVDAIESQNFTAVEHSQHPPVESPSLESTTPSTRSSLSADDVKKITPARVYIGGLPFDVRGQELINGLSELCGQYGIVKDVSLGRYRDQSEKSIEAGKHRGFVFVTMETPDQAQALIDDNLSGVSMWGRVLLVNYGLVPRNDQSKKEKTVLRCKVFVGNLHESTSSADLDHHFEQYGPIQNIKVITEFGSTRSRGFAFVTFKEESQAMRAVLDKDGSILDGAVISVNIAKYPQAD